jgi:hypothetical protein
LDDELVGDGRTAGAAFPRGLRPRTPSSPGSLALALAIGQELRS